MATDLSLAPEQIDALRKAVAQLQDGGDTAPQRKKACALAQLERRSGRPRRHGRPHFESGKDLNNDIFAICCPSHGYAVC